MIPRRVEVYRHSRFLGGRAVRFDWRGWHYAYALLRRDDPLDPPVNSVQHPRWTGGWSWTTRRGIVARCRYRGS